MKGIRTRRRLAIVAGAGVLAALAGAAGTSALAGPARAGDDQTEITVWDPQILASSSNGVVDKKKSFIFNAAAKFEKENPSIKVKVVENSGDITAWTNQFRAASIARNGPDLKVGFTGGGVLSFSKFLEPLDGYFSKADQAKITGWSTTRENFARNGKILALPYGAGSYFYVFYRPSLLKKAGVKMTSPPKTWEGLLALAKKVKAGGVTPFWVANQEGYVGAWVVAALEGGLKGPNVFYDMRAKKLPIDDPSMAKVYDAYAQVYKDGLTNKDAGSVGNNQALTGLIQGKGAMVINGAWNNGPAVDALKGDVKTFPIPTLKGSAYPGILAGGPNVAVMLTNYSKHKPEAVKFLKFLARPDVLDMYVQASGVEPSNSLQANTSKITNPLLRQQAAQLKQVKTVFPFDNVMPTEVNDLFYRLNAVVFTGRESADGALEQLQGAYKGPSS